jgi:hypothetical protein
MNPVIRSHWKQIKRIRSWVGQDVEDVYGNGAASLPILRTVARDDNGHGTYTAALLIKVAPGADVFVARIATGREVNNMDHVADVQHSPSTIGIQAKLLSRLSDGQTRYAKSTSSQCHSASNTQTTKSTMPSKTPTAISGSYLPQPRTTVVMAPSPTLQTNVRLSALTHVTVTATVPASTPPPSPTRSTSVPLEQVWSCPGKAAKCTSRERRTRRPLQQGSQRHC